MQRKVASRIDGFSTYPMWPLPELTSETLMPHNDRKKNENNPPLPPLILTHDVDTQFGFDHIMDVCEVEKRLGFKSSWNIVPDLYEVDESVLGYLRDSGMEIGVHDWNHDGRLFSDKKIFDERVKKINRVIKRWGAKGFRAGMAFHNDEWMQELDCEYDSSYYDTDPFQPMGGGCGKIRPFMLGHLVELPYTMPQDHVLFVAGAEVRVPLNYDDADMQRRDNWEWVCRYIERRNSYPQITQINADYFVSRKGAKARRLKTVSRPSTISRSYGAGRAYRGHRKFKDADYLIKGVDIWKMKAEWLMEQGGMVLMITHPDYLCHNKLVKRKEERGKREGQRTEDGKGQRSEVRSRMSEGQEQGAEDGGRKTEDSLKREDEKVRRLEVEKDKEQDDWMNRMGGRLGDGNRDIVEVREKGIVEQKWYGSLLEQYAGFLNWFKREFEGKYRYCLAWKLVRTPKEYAPLSQVNSTGQGLRRPVRLED